MKEQKEQLAIAVVLKQASVQSRIAEVLGERSAQFASSIISLVNSNDKLKQADARSVVASAMIAATLDLPVNKDLGFAHIVPYAGVAQLQIGYKGYVQLAMRSGMYRHLNACEVYEGELISSSKLTGEVVIDQTKRTSDQVIGYAAYMELLNGFKHSIYWTLDQVESHAKRFSQAYKSDKKDSPWFTSFDLMAIKTVLKSLLSKWGALSIALQKAMTEDQAVHRDIDAEAEYIDGESKPVEQETKQGAKALAAKLSGNADVKKEDNLDMGTPVKQKSRDEIIAEIKPLIESTKATKLQKVANAVGIEWEQFDAWEQATDEKLQSLLSLLKC